MNHLSQVESLKLDLDVAVNDRDAVRTAMEAMEREKNAVELDLAEARIFF